MFGLFNIDKPPGITSRKVVDYVQRLVRPAKAGHAGTLDPLATGVLVVCVGPATRLIEYVQRMPKRYVGTFLLGRSSPTEDVEGEVELIAGARVPDRGELEAAAARLTGPILQRPPAFSALKLAGERAYDLARAGREVVLQPREIMIHRLSIVRYEYPELVLEIECSSGTYVRSLGRDLAEAVGTAAVMSALARTAIGPFRLEDAISLPSITAENVELLMLSPVLAVADLPRLDLNDEQLALVRRGQPLPASRKRSDPEWAAFDPSGRLAAILVRRGGKLFPERNFAASAQPD